MKYRNVSTAGIQLYRAAAIAGATVWAAYALIECFLLTIANRLMVSDFAFQQVNLEFSAFLLVLYPVLGALLGATAALVVFSRRSSLGRRNEATPMTVEASGSLPLLLIAGAAQIAVPSGVWRLFLPVVGLAGALAAAMLLQIYARQLGEGVRFLTRPWTVAVLLCGSPWAADLAGDRPALAAAAALSMAGSIVALAYGLSRARRRSAALIDSRRRSPLWRGPVLYVAAAALLLAVGSPPQGARHLEPPASIESAAHNRPNLVLVTLDTVRADHLSLYGYPRQTSPRLERLAAEATVYERAIASAPMTLDSHATIFTGLYPRRHGTHYQPPQCSSLCPLDEQFETLAERLARIGYRTAGVVANYGYLSSAFGLDQGFQIYDERGLAPPFREVPTYLLRNAIAAFLTPMFSPELSERIYRSAGEITRQAVNLVDEMADGDRPFFLFVNYMDAHEPYRPPAPFDRFFPGKDESFRRRDFVALERAVLSLQRPVQAHERAHLTSQYDGAIAYLDAELDRLVRHLRDLGTYDDTVLVITSDHGEAFGERGLLDHQVSTYQDQVRVPLVVKLPGQRQGRWVEETVSLADLFPTLLELAGAEVPSGIDGTSLIAEQRPDRRLIVSESYSNHFLERLHPRFRRILRAAYRGRRVLHVSTAGTREAYELADDPDEIRPLDSSLPEFQSLDAELASWLTVFPAASPESPATVDAETRERLRALGYL